jgi:putative oxidoreductase
MPQFVRAFSLNHHHSTMSYNSIVERWKALEPYLLSLLRITTAFLFLLYGTTKLYALPAPVMPDGGTAPLLSLGGVAGAIELIAGVLLVFGLFTRPVAFILAGEMAVAYWYAHAPMGIWPVLNGGAAAFVYAFLWLYISSAGAGPWSFDALRQHRRERRRAAGALGH